jgi:hypothetical protein
LLKGHAHVRPVVTRFRNGTSPLPVGAQLFTRREATA